MKTSLTLIAALILTACGGGGSGTETIAVDVTGRPAGTPASASTPAATTPTVAPTGPAPAPAVITPSGAAGSVPIAPATPSVVTQTTPTAVQPPSVSPTTPATAALPLPQGCTAGPRCNVDEDGYAYGFSIREFSAPADQVSVCHALPFYVWGSGLDKVELVDGLNPTRKYGIFEVSDDRTYAGFALDGVADGYAGQWVYVSIVAYDLFGKSRVVMPSRSVRFYSQSPCIMGQDQRR